MNPFPENFSLVYMGTPEISATVFEALLKEGYPIKALIASPDKPVGRKKEIRPVPTKEVALRYGIPVFQPAKIRLDYEFLKELKPDLILTMAYGQIVPQGVLDIPRLGCLNLHGSLLPKLRGAAPIQRAIANGEEVTGVTLMEMVAAMDAGAMFAKKEVTILDSDDYGSLSKKIAEAAIALTLDSLPLYVKGLLAGVPQNEDEVTFADKIKLEDEHISLDLNAEQICHYVRALSPEPGAYLLLGEEKLKIYRAEKEDDIVNEPIGSLTFAKKKTLLQVKDGHIRLTSLLPQGKKIMDGASFANGYAAKYQGSILK